MEHNNKLYLEQNYILVLAEGTAIKNVKYFMEGWKVCHLNSSAHQSYQNSSSPQLQCATVLAKLVHVFIFIISEGTM